MSLEQQLLKVKKQLKEDENELVRIETEKKLELKKLQKIGIKTTTEARKLIGEWKNTKDRLQQEIQAKIDSIHEVYGEYI